MSRCDLDDTWRLPVARDDAFTDACVNVSHADVTLPLTKSWFRRVRPVTRAEGHSSSFCVMLFACSRVQVMQLKAASYIPPGNKVAAPLAWLHLCWSVGCLSLLLLLLLIFPLLFSSFSPFSLHLSSPFIYLASLICVSLCLIASSPRRTLLSWFFIYYCQCVIFFHIYFHFSFFFFFPSLAPSDFPTFVPRPPLLTHVHA